MRTSEFLRIVFALTLAGTGGCTTGNASSQGAAQSHGFVLSDAQRQRIHIEKIEPAPFLPTVLTTGTVAFNGDRSTPVLSPISGPIGQVLVNTGTRVEPGTPLATVASPDFSADIAAYQKAQTALHNAARIATLDEQLFQNDAIARSDLDQARADSASASADREAALEQIVSLGVDEATIDSIRQGKPVPAGAGTIRAPIGGVVVEKLVSPGELIQGGTTQCFTIADLSTVWVMANVFESDLAAVAPGEQVVVTTAAAPDSFAGRIEYVGALVDPSTRATTARVVVRNHKDLLKRDMYVDVAIQSTRQQSGLLVPTSAVLRDADNLPFVFVQRPDGGFDRRHVSLGSRVADRYEVTSGLVAHEQVVTEGALFLQFAASQ